MSIDFSKFDEQVNAEQLQHDIAEAKENGGYKEVPKGSYTCKLENLELGETKDHRPMVKAMFRIIGDEDGEKSEFNKSCLFMNRVIYGTKNDANMIASALGFLTKLEPSEDIVVEFRSYSQFAELCMDIAEDVSEELEYLVKYDPDAFNSISIEEAFEVE